MTIKFFKNVDEYQLFFSAVENNNLHVVEQVIPYLSNINRYHQKGEILCTALAVAAGNGSLEMTRLLLANKANFDAPVLQCLFSFPEGNPVIVSEDEFKEPKEGELLFRYPVISNPLMMAAEKGQKETFELLKEAGANLHQLTLNGRPIFVSVEKGNLAMLSLYLEAGIDVNEKNEEGDTLLHRAAKLSDPVITQRLLRAGANTDILNLAGQKPVHYAKTEEVKNFILYGPDYWKCPCVLL